MGGRVIFTEKSDRPKEVEYRRSSLARKFGAGILFVAASSAIGVFIGWDDARSDQTTLDAKIEILAGYRKQAAITREMIKANETSVSPVCRLVAEPYISGDNQDVDIISAAHSIDDVEACGPSAFEYLYVSRRDLRDLNFNKTVAAEAKSEIPELTSDAARNDELWQFGLGTGVLGAAAGAFAIVIAREA